MQHVAKADLGKVGERAGSPESPESRKARRRADLIGRVRSGKNMRKPAPLARDSTPAPRRCQAPGLSREQSLVDHMERPAHLSQNTIRCILRLLTFSFPSASPLAQAGRKILLSAQFTK